MTHAPDMLEKNKCFMLSGSRRDDRRVPAMWISERAPKLGWCWDGNPHTRAGRRVRRAAAGRESGPWVRARDIQSDEGVMMSIGDKAKNKAEQATGQAKETTGRATGDDDLKAEGKADQADAHTKQAGEKVKDAAKEVKDGFKS